MTHWDSFCSCTKTASKPNQPATSLISAFASKAGQCTCITHKFLNPVEHLLLWLTIIKRNFLIHQFSNYVGHCCKVLQKSSYKIYQVSKSSTFTQIRDLKVFNRQNFLGSGYPLLEDILKHKTWLNQPKVTFLGVVQYPNLSILLLRPSTAHSN